MVSLRTLVAATLIGCVQVASANETGPGYRACYDNPGSLKFNETFAAGLSEGVCLNVCVEQNEAAGGDGFAVMGLTKGTECYCGNTFPHPDHKVSDSKCNFGCPGFPLNKCGTRDGAYMAVYITGLEKEPRVDEKPATSSTSSKSSSSETSTSSTISTTQTSDATENGSSKGNTVNKGAVAAGVVIGVLLILAIGGGGFLYIRNRNRQQVEEEYRRSAAAREFSQKPPSDHRLDPGMVQRRDSVGSIADNQDYSRRILKVTNPDG